LLNKYLKCSVWRLAVRYDPYMGRSAPKGYATNSTNVFLTLILYIITGEMVLVLPKVWKFWLRFWCVIAVVLSGGVCGLMIGTKFGVFCAGVFGFLVLSSWLTLCSLQIEEGGYQTFWILRHINYMGNEVPYYIILI
jgi:hypothetical protein